ncbi:mersacidin/lichenicidin family type 2 lantibiotic [Streptomyces sp. LX-29]|uniref:mersacidin/lichenicidin family type 2 lantibiotic n=1 Tax=Streptomyces sp. LX-29 TaxID=2900152 RepID=UPI00240DD003|nr:mersacidin/lichenicidin family type 2 lantibiotic [Streptomyces sp. LX-29]WFB11309.1 mersacidin/lichenicidin family type 2 lantibiotic [Streptomyces sp. LX-29]
MDVPHVLGLLVNAAVRAWKDPAFRTTLDEAALAALPDSPVGVVGGIDADLAEIFGGDRPFTFHTCFTCAWGSLGCTNTCWVMTTGCTSGSC